LDVVVRKSPAIFKLLASEDESLLIGWDTLLVLDLGLDVLDRVRRLDVEGDRLTLNRWLVRARIMLLLTKATYR
jgi:hypothetical protein